MYWFVQHYASDPFSVTRCKYIPRQLVPDVVYLARPWARVSTYRIIRAMVSARQGYFVTKQWISLGTEI